MGFRKKQANAAARKLKQSWDNIECFIRLHSQHFEVLTLQDILREMKREFYACDGDIARIIKLRTRETTT